MNDGQINGKNSSKQHFSNTATPTSTPALLPYYEGHQGRPFENNYEQQKDLVVSSADYVNTSLGLTSSNNNYYTNTNTCSQPMTVPEQKHVLQSSYLSSSSSPGPPPNLPYLRTSVSVPFSWKRVLSNNKVVYISPSNCPLRSLQEVAFYLSSEGTCKCGLECPLMLTKVFNFDPQVASQPFDPLSWNPSNSSPCVAKHKIYSTLNKCNLITEKQLQPSLGLAKKENLLNCRRRKHKGKNRSPFDGVLVSQLLAQRDKFSVKKKEEEDTKASLFYSPNHQSFNESPQVNNYRVSPVIEAKDESFGFPKPQQQPPPQQQTISKIPILTQPIIQNVNIITGNTSINCGGNAPTTNHMFASPHQLQMNQQEIYHHHLPQQQQRFSPSLGAENKPPPPSGKVTFFTNKELQCHVDVRNLTNSSPSPLCYNNGTLTVQQIYPSNGSGRLVKRMDGGIQQQSHSPSPKLVSYDAINSTVVVSHGFQQVPSSNIIHTSMASHNTKGQGFDDVSSSSNGRTDSNTVVSSTGHPCSLQSSINNSNNMVTSSSFGGLIATPQRSAESPLVNMSKCLVTVAGDNKPHQLDMTNNRFGSVPVSIHQPQFTFPISNTPIQSNMIHHNMTTLDLHNSSHGQICSQLQLQPPTLVIQPLLGTKTNMSPGNGTTLLSNNKLVSGMLLTSPNSGSHPSSQHPQSSPSQMILTASNQVSSTGQMITVLPTGNSHQLLTSAQANNQQSHIFVSQDDIKPTLLNPSQTVLQNGCIIMGSSSQALLAKSPGATLLSPTPNLVQSDMNQNFENLVTSSKDKQQGESNNIFLMDRTKFLDASSYHQTVPKTLQEKDLKGIATFSNIKETNRVPTTLLKFNNTSVPSLLSVPQSSIIQNNSFLSPNDSSKRMGNSPMPPMSIPNCTSVTTSVSQVIPTVGINHHMSNQQPMVQVINTIPFNPMQNTLLISNNGQIQSNGSMDTTNLLTTPNMINSVLLPSNSISYLQGNQMVPTLSMDDKLIELHPDNFEIPTGSSNSSCSTPLSTSSTPVPLTMENLLNSPVAKKPRGRETKRKLNQTVASMLQLGAQANNNNNNQQNHPQHPHQQQQQQHISPMMMQQQTAQQIISQPMLQTVVLPTVQENQNRPLFQQQIVNYGGNLTPFTTNGQILGTSNFTTPLGIVQPLNMINMSQSIFQNIPTIQQMLPNGQSVTILQDSHLTQDHHPSLVINNNGTASFGVPQVQSAFNGGSLVPNFVTSPMIGSPIVKTEIISNHQPLMSMQRGNINSSQPHYGSVVQPIFPVQDNFSWQHQIRPNEIQMTNFSPSSSTIVFAQSTIKDMIQKNLSNNNNISEDKLILQDSRSMGGSQNDQQSINLNLDKNHLYPNRSVAVNPGGSPTITTTQTLPLQRQKVIVNQNMNNSSEGDYNFLDPSNLSEAVRAVISQSDKMLPDSNYCNNSYENNRSYIQPTKMPASSTVSSSSFENNSTIDIRSTDDPLIIKQQQQVNSNNTMSGNMGDTYTIRTEKIWTRGPPLQNYISEGLDTFVENASTTSSESLADEQVTSDSGVESGHEPVQNTRSNGGGSQVVDSTNNQYIYGMEQQRKGIKRHHWETATPLHHHVVTTERNQGSEIQNNQIIWQWAPQVNDGRT